jgi:pyridoxine kinase
MQGRFLYLKEKAYMKRVVTIQDISCVGKCSLTVALPLISSLGIETAILPTAVLSVHTQFKDFTCKNLQDDINPIADSWKANGIDFDGIYTGYLASGEQIDLVRNFIKRFDGDEVLKFIDPAMADFGKLYAGFSKDFPKEMAKLCGDADVIVPNLTEACFLTGLEYSEEYDEGFIKKVLKALVDLGVKKYVCLTGVSLNPAKNGFIGYDIEKDEYFSYEHERMSRSYHGTGDIFSSVAFANLMNGKNIREALKIAADFVVLSIRETIENDSEKEYAVDFERVIPELIEMSKS